MTANGQTQQVLAPLRTKGANLLAEANKYAIKNQENADEVNNILIRITAGLREVEKRRKERTGPINETLKLINGDFKRATESFNEAKRILTGKLMDWRAEQRRLDQEREEAARREEERRLKIQEAHKEAGHQVKETTAPVVRQPTFDTRDTTKTRKNWTFEITDLLKVPFDYLVVDPSAIRKAIRAAERDEEGRPVIEIPGVRIFASEVPVFG